MDWDQDGQLDLLSGSYVIPGTLAGHLHFLKGKSDGQFEAAQVLLNAKGDPARNVEADSSDVQRSLINYCTHQHAIDFDEDGDLDLIVGSNKDEFFFHENTAGKDKKVSLSADTEPLSIRLPDGARHSAPHMVDWDSDGDLDLITGTSAGGVLLAKNSGTAKEPYWGGFELLVPFCSKDEMESEIRIDQLQLGRSTRVWVCDYNKDGLLDLVVGDCVEAAELKSEEIRSEYLDALVAYYQLVDENKNGPELTAAREKCEQLTTRRKTGFVWVFLQEPKQTADKL